MKTVEQFVRETEGKAFDVDKAYGVQCVDGFRKFCLWAFGASWATGTGRADGYWKKRFESPASKYFDFIPAGQERSGDWCFWEYKKSCYPLSHVAMCYWKDGVKYMYGQNQSGSHSGFSLAKAKNWNILGAFRWKGWEGNMVQMIDGFQSMVINGHYYSVYKQESDEKIALLSAGANKVKDFKALDRSDIYVYAKVGNGNFYQMANKAADPYGTTYGDMVSPMDNVYFILPNQKNNLYYDLDDGTYGSVKDAYPDKTHNVFSPALVFHDNTYEYAPMVGYNHVNSKSVFTGVLKCNDGKYAFILGKDGYTPRDMWNDFKSFGKNLAILDGGGSAQMGAWNGTSFIYPRYTGRAIASAIVAYKPKENEPEKEPTDDVYKQKNAELLAENTDLKAKVAKYESKLKQIREIAND